MNLAKLTFALGLSGPAGIPRVPDPLEWNRCKKWARKVYGTLPREYLDLILGQYLFRRNLDAPAACTCKINNKQQRSIECPACNLRFFDSAMRAMNLL